MKKILISIFLLFFISGCGGEKNKSIEEQICPQCNMPLVSKKDSAKAIIDGETIFFDDIGCLILWLKEKKLEHKDINLLVYSLDSKKYLDVKNAYYSINDKTPMNYGFGAYEKNGENLIDFETMRIKMLRGENLTDPKIRKKILGY